MLYCLICNHQSGKKLREKCESNELEIQSVTPLKIISSFNHCSLFYEICLQIIVSCSANNTMDICAPSVNHLGNNFDISSFIVQVLNKLSIGSFTIRTPCISNSNRMRTIMFFHQLNEKSEVLPLVEVLLVSCLLT